VTALQLTAASRLADRLWELHSADLQDMSEEELAGYAADQLAPLDPTISDLHGVVERLRSHQRDNARPPDAKRGTSDDPLERYFQ
jgi:hypothetical protein